MTPGPVNPGPFAGETETCAFHIRTCRLILLELLRTRDSEAVALRAGGIAILYNSYNSGRVNIDEGLGFTNVQLYRGIGIAACLVL